MRILAVDTSCTTASVAVTEDGKVIAELSTQHAKTHSQKLVPMIESLMALMDTGLDTMDLFAAAIGPGSFTGLRIGVVTIKGMAYALKKPVSGVPTLDALAWSVKDFDGIVCPMLDARNQQVYTALYEVRHGDMNRISDYMGLPVSELVGSLKAYDQDLLILGDATYLHYDQLKRELHTKLYRADPVLYTPRAACTALIAENLALQGISQNAFELEPLYLRKSQAERMKEQA